MKNYLKIYKNNIFSKLVCYFDDIKKAIGETKHILKFDTEGDHDLSEVDCEYADLLNWLENKETIIVEVDGKQYNLTVKGIGILVFSSIWGTSSKSVVINNDDSVMMESETLDEAKTFSVDFNLLDLEDGDSVICDEDLYEKLFDAVSDNVDIYLRTNDGITLRLNRIDSGLIFVYDGIMPDAITNDFKYIVHLPDDERAWQVYKYYRSNVLRYTIADEFSGFTSRQMTYIINAINRGDNVLISWMSGTYRYCPVSYHQSTDSLDYLDGTSMTNRPHIAFTNINGMVIDSSGEVVGLNILMLNAISNDVNYGKVAHTQI